MHFPGIAKTNTRGKQLKVTPDLRGCPPGKKNRMHAILKKNMANYISLKRLKNADFRKNMNCRFLQFPIRTLQTTAKMTMYHPIELIGYQIQNNCTVLITKDQPTKVRAFFDILTGYFLINLSSLSSKEKAMRTALN